MLYPEGFSQRAYYDLYRKKQEHGNLDNIEYDKRMWPLGLTGPEAYSLRFQRVLGPYINAPAHLREGRQTDLLPEEMLGFLVNERKSERNKERKKVRALDVMSFGQVLRDLDISGAAMALSDGRNGHMKQEDSIRGSTFIEGDVLSTKTWNTLDHLYPQGGDFDFIFC